LFWGRVVRQLVVSRGRVTSRGLAGVMLLTVVVLAGGAFAGDPAALEAGLGGWSVAGGSGRGV
jgi:hypothetical protein